MYISLRFQSHRGLCSPSIGSSTSKLPQLLAKTKQKAVAELMKSDCRDLLSAIQKPQRLNFRRSDVTSNMTSVGIKLKF